MNSAEKAYLTKKIGKCVIMSDFLTHFELYGEIISKPDIERKVIFAQTLFNDSNCDFWFKQAVANRKDFPNS